MDAIKCIARQRRAVLLIDPAPLRRKALVRLLAQTQGAIEGVSTVNACTAHAEGLVLVALERSLIRSGVAEAQLEAIRARMPRAPVAAYGDFDDDFSERALMLAGYDGAISLDVDGPLLEAAIEVLSVGGSYYPRLACVKHRTEPRLRASRANATLATRAPQRPREARTSMIRG